jgi:hypothetical protein
VGSDNHSSLFSLGIGQISTLKSGLCPKHPSSLYLRSLRSERGLEPFSRIFLRILGLLHDSRCAEKLVRDTGIQSALDTDTRTSTL